MSHAKPQVAPPVSVERVEVTEDELRELGVDLARDFPGSTAEDFRRYPVLSEGGWFEVIKHQTLLSTVLRRPWHLLGPVNILSTTMDLD